MNVTMNVQKNVTRKNGAGTVMMDKEAKIYVAGHRGMVGSAIVRRLEKEGVRESGLKDILSIGPSQSGAGGTVF